MKYVFSAVFSKEKGGYSVLCPELGVSSQGKTLKDAEENIQEAVALYIHDLSREDLEPYTRSIIDLPTVRTFEVSHV